MRAARSAAFALLLAPICLEFVACGDVHSDLITGRAGTDSGCTSDSDCPAPGSICNTATGVCRPACMIGGDAASSSCECDEHEDCTRGEFRICDEQRGSCVECVEDRFCRDANEFCNTVFGVCAERCGSCSEGDFCDSVTGFCVECLTSDDCSGGLACRNAECGP